MSKEKVDGMLTLPDGASVEVIDRPSSIEVSQNAKGQYSYKVKLYFSEQEESGEEVVDRIKGIYDKIQRVFK